MGTGITRPDGLKAIDIGLEAFEKRKSEVSDLVSLTKGVTLEDWRDKASLKALSAMRKKLKAERVSIQNEGKAMRDLITPISKHIKSKEEELVSILEPEERRLQGIEDWAASEAEKERVAEIEAENARIQKRIDDLAQFGYQIDYSDIKGMSEETFTKYIDAARAQFEKEKAEREEQERERREREEIENAKREEEARRLAQEREELARLRRESEEREAELKRQLGEIARQQKEAMLMVRRAKLSSIGGIDEHGNDVYKYKGILLAGFYEIHDLSEQEWAGLVSRLPGAIEKHDSEIAIKEKERVDELARAADNARKKAIEEAKEAERAKMEQEEKARLAAERKAARQPDKVKIKSYIELVKAVPIPDLKTDDGREVMANIQVLIKRFDEYSTQKAEEL